MKMRSVPGAVLGIIATVFAFIGGSYVAFCATLMGSAVGGEAGGVIMIVTYLLGFGGAVVGLIGAILDFRKPVAGGVLQLLALVMVLVVCIFVTFSFWEVIAMILFLIGGILSFAVKKPLPGQDDEYYEE